MDNKFLEICRKYLITHYALVHDVELKESDVYCVWFCKTLKNAKALVSTTVPDTRYFEFTFDRDKNQIYFDGYVKETSKCIEVEEDLF